MRTFHDAIRRDLLDEEVVGPVDSSRICPLSFIDSTEVEASPSPKIVVVRLSVDVSVTKLFLQVG